MSDPRPIDDLIVLHVNEEALDMGAPGWVQHKAIFRLGEVAAWVKGQRTWDVLKTGSTELGTKYGDLPVFKLILA